MFVVHAALAETPRYVPHHLVDLKQPVLLLFFHYFPFFSISEDATPPLVLIFAFSTVFSLLIWLH